MRPTLPSLSLVAGLLIALLTLIPLFFIIMATVEVGGDVAYRLLFRPRMAELFANTLTLMAAAVPLCAVIGVGAAWLVERTTLPGRRVWHLLLAAPLAVPAFVNSFGWVSWLGGRVEGAGGRLQSSPCRISPSSTYRSPLHCAASTRRSKRPHARSDMVRVGPSGG